MAYRRRSSNRYSSSTYSKSKKKGRYCRICGESLAGRPKNYYLCFSCWKSSNSKTSEDDIDTEESYNDDDDGYSMSDLRRIQEENGLSDEDMANGAWIDF